MTRRELFLKHLGNEDGLAVFKANLTQLGWPEAAFEKWIEGEVTVKDYHALWKIADMSPSELEAAKKVAVAKFRLNAERLENGNDDEQQQLNE